MKLSDQFKQELRDIASLFPHAQVVDALEHAEKAMVRELSRDKTVSQRDSDSLDILKHIKAIFFDELKRNFNDQDKQLRHEQEKHRGRIKLEEHSIDRDEVFYTNDKFHAHHLTEVLFLHDKLSPSEKLNILDYMRKRTARAAYDEAWEILKNRIQINEKD